MRGLGTHNERTHWVRTGLITVNAAVLLAWAILDLTG